MNDYDDPMTESACLDFLCRALHEGRPESHHPCFVLSNRLGDLVTIFGASGRIAQYQVHRHPSGQEYVLPVSMRPKTGKPAWYKAVNSLL